jgi:hypothetical protein
MIVPGDIPLAKGENAVPELSVRGQVGKEGMSTRERPMRLTRPSIPTSNRKFRGVT